MNPEHLVAALADPACYPHAPRTVRLVQTHLSIVCLVDQLVYKLKKAVTLPFVDFAPLAARRQACRDEVRLNRRACPDVYLGTASLRQSADGGLRFAALGDDEGPDDVDVAVVMRRLPQERMLDELLRAHAVTGDEITALAAHVAAFHARCEVLPPAAGEQLVDDLLGFATANFTELAAIADHGQPPPLLSALRLAHERAFAALAPQLRARAQRGLCIDGHGDLHARNVCMTVPPALYDCIEFEPRFRRGDQALDVAFLLMDLRYRGAAALAASFVREYANARGDAELPALLPTLCAYRAMVRAKVALFAARETELPAADRDGARQSARRHLELAAALQLEALGPRWLVLCGPPASGKSQLAGSLVEIAGWRALATDVVRKELAGLAPTERARTEHYTPEFSQHTYDELLARAAAATRDGAEIVLLDGNFPTPTHRAAAEAAASACGARVVFVHVDVDRTTAIARAKARAQDPARVSDADAAVAAARHDAFVRPIAAEGHVLVGIDGTAARPQALAAMFAGVLATAD
ncbi:MAG: AAA family ATPase [Planctomycetota bacterium]|jgi:aminoglycoside phosphotransferase family enzyme/predicted kinase